jgi:TP901 family phage tail tape measure protein
LARESIGSLLVRVGVDLTDFERQMNDLNRQFGRLGTQVQEAGTQIGMAFGAVSLAIAGGLGYAVKKAADFEEGLSKISAVSGATAEQMEEFKKVALEMGKSGYGATEAAQGIEELVKAGVSMEAILDGGLKGALNLATAGELELAEAAEIASTVLNSFKKDNLSVADAADILAGSANASATSVQEMKFGLSQVSAVASMVGMSFVDTSAALAAFAQNGLKGSDAGTSLKTMLMNLQPSTKGQITLAKELGIITKDGANAFYDSAGNLKSLDQIAGVLQQSLKGMSAAQQQSTLKTLFGSDAVRAAAILYKEGAEGVRKMKNEMSKTTAEDVSKKKLDNFNGSMKILKATFDNFMISIGDSLVPAIKTIADKLGEMADWFNSLPEPVKKFIAVGAALTALFTGMIAVVGILVGALGGLVAVQWAVLWPVLAIIAAVVLIIAYYAALAYGIKKLYDSNESFRKAVDTVWTAIKNIIQTAIDVIVPIAKSVWESFKENLMSIWEMVKPVLEELWNTISSLFGNISGEGDSKMQKLKAVFEWVFSRIGTYIKIAMAVWTAIIKVALSIIIIIFKYVFTFIKTYVTVIFNIIKTVIITAMDIIKGIIKTVSKVLKGDWKGAWDAIKETVSKVVGNIGEFLGKMKDTFLEAGKGFIDALVKGIKDAAGGVTDAVKDIAKKVRDFLPFSPAKVGPLSDLDKLDFAGPITAAMKAGTPDVQAQMNSMLTVPDVSPSVTNDMGAGTTLIMQLDGKTIAKKTFEHFGGTLRMRGAVT